MPDLPAVIPGEPVDANTFGNPVLVRVLSRYATAAERDALSPTPDPGEPAYIAATNEVQIWDGSAWVPLAQRNYESLLVYGEAQGFWLRPDPADNTKDFRLVGAGGTVLLQSRATGAFSTVAGFNPASSYRPYGIAQGSDRPVSSITISANVGADQQVQTMNVPFGGWWRITQAGFIEASTSADLQWIMFTRTTPGGTIISEAQYSHRGSVVGTNARGVLSASVVFDFGTGTDVELVIQRSATGGTQLLRRVQMHAEWLGPKP